MSHTICDVLSILLAQSHALPFQLHAAALQHNIHTAICSCLMSLVVTGRHSSDMLRWSTGPSGVPAQDLPSSLLAPLMRLQKSFVLSDPRLPDCPIVHASTAFLLMTGYPRSVSQLAYSLGGIQLEDQRLSTTFNCALSFTTASGFKVHVYLIQAACCIQRECATKLLAALSLQHSLCTESTYHTGPMQLDPWDCHVYTQTLPLQIVPAMELMLR